jgi:TonB family protein
VSAGGFEDASLAWYRSALANALYGAWKRPIVSGLTQAVEVRVSFEIMRDGNVRGLRIDESSGVPMLDRSALRAVSDASPLPALPATMGAPYVPASIVFRLYPEGAQG